MGHTPGPVNHSCKKCGWSGLVNGRPRCLACWRRRSKEWHAANPDKSRDVTRQQLVAIAERDGHICTYCKQPVRYRFSPLDPRGFDHVQPRSKGGKHTAANIVSCCRSCNELKADTWTMAS